MYNRSYFDGERLTSVIYRSGIDWFKLSCRRNMPSGSGVAGARVKTSQLSHTLFRKAPDLFPGGDARQQAEKKSRITPLPGQLPGRR